MVHEIPIASWAKFSQSCPNSFWKMPRFSNRPFLGTTLCFLSSRAYPDFLLHRSHKRPLMWFSLKRTTCS